MQSPSVPNFYSSGFPPSSPFPSANGTTEVVNNSPTPKRNQVKNACTNCQKACKKCADERPCPRCTKYGISDTCVSSVRKERKKGIKRGPYKRRQKSTDDKIENKDANATYALNAVLTSIADTNAIATPTTVSNTTSTSTTTATTTTTATSTIAATTTTATPGVTPADYGYPSQLSQYGQYYQYSSSNDDKSIPNQYMLPVYPNYPPPVLVDGDTTTTVTTQDNTESKDETNKENTPEESNTNSTSYLAHQALSIILNSATNSDTTGIYYPNNNTQEKTQPLTPVPSTSNTSGTASPSENHDEEDKFTRLTQLCTAALRENLESKNKESTDSSENETAIKNE